jgi:hypothetical protein
MIARILLALALVLAASAVELRGTEDGAAATSDTDASGASSASVASSASDAAAGGEPPITRVFPLLGDPSGGTELHLRGPGLLGEISRVSCMWYGGGACILDGIPFFCLVFFAFFFCSAIVLDRWNPLCFIL